MDFICGSRKKTYAIVVAVLVAALSIVDAAAEPRPVLARDQVWKYQDGGSDLGTSWKELAFDDGAWKSGVAPLGFGDDVSETDPNLPIGTVVGFGRDPSDKNMTTYFRTEIEVPSLDSLVSLRVYAHVDDGAVVYVNGIEAFRRGIPEGPVSFSTSGKFKPKEEIFELPASILKPGLNVIAAEVHQDDGASSDLWWEMGITAEIPAVAAAVEDTTPAIAVEAGMADPSAPLGTVTKLVASIFGDPRREMGFTWFTTKASGNSDIQVLPKTGGDPDFSRAATFTGTTRPAANAPAEFVHKGAAYGMNPGTAYWYRVGDAARDLWSGTGGFTTARSKGAFTFIDMADTQAKSAD
ncbi:MAG: fibronectin type III domain-containing protein, partial [Spirochaetaceae bacterium]|nr:fibronectin type III domain-containing protein [Spirochaetaceae bacterium]